MPPTAAALRLSLAAAGLAAALSQDVAFEPEIVSQFLEYSETPLKTITQAGAHKNPKQPVRCADLLFILSAILLSFGHSEAHFEAHLWLIFGVYSELSIPDWASFRSLCVILAILELILWIGGVGLAASSPTPTRAKPRR